MKKLIPLIVLSALLCLTVNSFMSCATKTKGTIGEDTMMVDSVDDAVDTITIDTKQSQKETKYATASLELGLPIGDGVAQTIREDLLKFIAKEIYYCASYGDKTVKGPTYTGDKKNIAAICSFYQKEMFKILEPQGKEDYKERVEGINSDETLTEAERKEQIAGIPGYDMEISLVLDNQTDKYIVFSEQVYSFCGGAHGSTTVDYFIYSKKDGKRIKAMLKPDVAPKMQRILKDGLKQYNIDIGESPISDKELMEDLMLPDDSKIIPLPQTIEIPTKEGLLFVYQQYEISAYAMGMPSFTIPYEKLKPYMTDEALELIK